MPMATRPQFPKAKVDESLLRRPTLRNFGPCLVSSQEALKFFTGLKFGAEATEPPFVTYSVPRLHMEPRLLPNAQFKRAMGDDVARQKTFGARRPFPSLGQLISARSRFVVAGELAGAWGRSEGIGAEWANLAQIALTELTQSQRTAARVLKSRNS